MDNDFTPQEQALIERLENAPQRHLSADAKEAIRQRMLAQVGAPTPAQSPHPQLNIRRFPVPALAAVAIITISLAGLVLAQYPTLINPPSSPSRLPISATAPTTATSGATPVTMVPSTVTTPIASPNPSQAVAFSLDGEVQAITANVITVNQTLITLAVNDPILKTIHVGDTVHIDGSIDQAGKLFASSVQTSAGGSNSSASIDGVVQAINNNVVTINGIQIQLPADYPGLASIKVGTFLSVDGYFASNGSTMILIVINVTVVPTEEVPTFEKCRTALPAMGMDVPPAMGQPDAMGMGESAMGPPDGMGMGEPAMGMGIPVPPAMGCN